MNYSAIDEIIKNALKEDMPNEDITANSVINKESLCSADLLSKDNGILAGLEVFGRVFELLGGVEIRYFTKDGDLVAPGDLIARLNGNTRNILQGERTALNLLQKMSGIATITKSFADQIEGTGARLLDTRKTTPGLRILEKYAVTVGGGHNHRYNLSDGIMLKDNHISAAGGIMAAVEAARKSCSFVRKIEVETETLDMVREALKAGADIIMLDNMDCETMKEAVKIIGSRAVTEASGNVSLKTIRAVAETGVRYISCGALTHSVKALDISLKNLVIKPPATRNYQRL
ncbi:MAG: carboxylating nicotinate-nucleotide diphosphorylase [Clostridiaceae bacterium]